MAERKSLDKDKIIFKECLQKVQATWLKIKILSRFNNQSLNSKEIYNYFHSIPKGDCRGKQHKETDPLQEHVG